MKSTRHLAALAFLLLGCGKEPQKAAFTGTWNFTEESPISNQTSTVQVTVLSAPPKFRQSTKTSGSEQTLVYDGASLHSKSTYEPAPSAYPSDMPSSEAEPQMPVSQTESVAFTPEQANAKRFWAQPLSGQSTPGGLIAGRDSLLYESKWKRPDGEFSNQIWVDAKTGIMLKSVESVYSSQAQALVRRETKECVSIDFSPPADAAFAQP